MERGDKPVMRTTILSDAIFRVLPCVFFFLSSCLFIFFSCFDLSLLAKFLRSSLTDSGSALLHLSILSTSLMFHESET